LTKTRHTDSKQAENQQDSAYPENWKCIHECQFKCVLKLKLVKPWRPGAGLLDLSAKVFGFRKQLNAGIGLVAIAM
jgi:hypothetical protein